jgi:hypothetical protein
VLIRAEFFLSLVRMKPVLAFMKHRVPLAQACAVDHNTTWADLLARSAFVPSRAHSSALSRASLDNVLPGPDASVAESRRLVALLRRCVAVSVRGQMYRVRAALLAVLALFIGGSPLPGLERSSLCFVNWFLG